MEVTRFMSKEQQQYLQKAREKYGDLRELSVSAEELNELAIVCNKFCRYNTKEGAQQALHDSVLTEVADVLIVLDHIVNIFNLTPDEIKIAIDGKMQRLQRWLFESEDMEVTTVDREIPGQQTLSFRNCPGCRHIWNFDNLKPGNRCQKCLSGESLFQPKEATDAAE